MLIWDKKEGMIEWETNIKMKNLPNFIFFTKATVFCTSVSLLSFLFLPSDGQ